MFVSTHGMLAGMSTCRSRRPGGRPRCASSNSTYLFLTEINWPCTRRPSRNTSVSAFRSSTRSRTVQADSPYRLKERFMAPPNLQLDQETINPFIHLRPPVFVGLLPILYDSVFVIQLPFLIVSGLIFFVFRKSLH